MAGIVHISDQEAARDVETLLEAVRSGAKVMIEAPGRRGVMMMIPEEAAKDRSIRAILEGFEERKGEQASSIVDDDELFTDIAEAHGVRSVAQSKPTFQSRTIAEAIEILRLREQTQGLAVPDPDMASDMEEIHALYNQPMDMSRWD